MTRSSDHRNGDKPNRYRKLDRDHTRTRIDVHEAITAKIIAAIEAGAGTFEMPWHRPGVSSAIPTNAETGKPYRGSNVLSLWIDAGLKRFEHPLWATYRQFAAMGAQVRKGEKGSLIVKYGEWVPRTDDAGSPKRQSERRQDMPGSDDEDGARRLYAKPAWVFNIDQVDLTPELRLKLLPPSPPRPDLTERLAHVDRFIAHTGAQIREGGQRAFYRHKDSKGDGDFIQMPPRELFTGTATSTPTEAYESCRLHELGHWSGAEHRLNRTFGRFGDNAYAFEELVAELAAAFLCAGIEITNTPRPDHAQYIAHWLEVMKGEKKAIFTAAALATRAVEYLEDLQPTPVEANCAEPETPARPDLAHPIPRDARRSP